MFRKIPSARLWKQRLAKIKIANKRRIQRTWDFVKSKFEEKWEKSNKSQGSAEKSNVEEKDSTNVGNFSEKSKKGETSVTAFVQDIEKRIVGG